MTKFLAALAFLALNFYTYNYLATRAVLAPRTAFDEFPMELDEWACVHQEQMEPDVIENLGVSDFLLCTFEREHPRQMANVYVGYHATQVREEGGGAGENSIHPPEHCLPGAGWDIIEKRAVVLDLPGLPQGPSRVNRLIIAKGDARQLVYYWYQSQGRVIDAGWKKIIYVGWDRATRGRTDGALVRFTMPVLSKKGGEERAEEAFASLAPKVVGLLARFVPE